MSNNSIANPKSLVERGVVFLALLLLIFSLYNVLRAFFGVFTFALIFSVSFHAVYEKLCRRFPKRRKLIAGLFAFIIIGVIVLPFIFFISALSHHVKDAIDMVNNVKTNGLPPLPDWIIKLPLVGDDINEFWLHVMDDPKATIALHEVQIKQVLHGLITRGVGIMGVTFETIAGVIVAALFLVNSEKVLYPIRMALKHIIGEKEAMSLEVAAAQAIKGVSIGVMGTAFISALFSWLGLVIVGVPFALLFAAIIFFLVLIQIGPTPVWIPLVIYMFVEGHNGFGIFLVVWGIALMAVDSLVKPLLISKSGKLPFLLLFIGVVGGLIAWGFTGMFMGAIVVTIFYTIFNSWLEQKETSYVED